MPKMLCFAKTKIVNNFGFRAESLMVGGFHSEIFFST